LESAKDTFFKRSFSLNLGGELVQYYEPVVMGILNTTPDSFFDGGKHADNYLHHVEKMLTDGAHWIDVGGMSTRPGAPEVSLEEELKRVIPIVELISKEFPQAFISVDTYRSQVAKAGIEAGGHIVNDISGGELDDQLFETIARLNVPYILMHMQGTPQNMQNDPQYQSVTREVVKNLSVKYDQLRLLGVSDIIIDPGFGFGKTVEQNYQMLRELDFFHLFNEPVLVGVSRKSMINKVLDTEPNDALNGTTVLNTLALQNGAHILRVHDVKEAVECIKLVKQYREA